MVLKNVQASETENPCVNQNVTRMVLPFRAKEPSEASRGVMLVDLCPFVWLDIFHNNQVLLSLVHAGSFFSSFVDLLKSP